MSGALSLNRPSLGRIDVNRVVLAIGAAALAGLALASATPAHATWRMPALVLTGAAIGAVLLRTTFGFAGAFRALIEMRDASGFRAHAVMLGLATALMMPLLAMGSLWGQPMAGGSTAVGVGFAVGALLFGAGMQVGGGCASGTLFSLGGGNARLIGTLLGFVAGSALGAAHMGFWWSLPALPAVTAQGLVGYGPAVALQLLALAGLWWAARRFSPARKAPWRLACAPGCARFRCSSGAASPWRCSTPPCWCCPASPGARPRPSRCGGPRPQWRWAGTPMAGPIGSARASTVSSTARCCWTRPR